MTTRIQQAMVRLTDRLEEFDGRSITYSQGSDCTIGGIKGVQMDAEYKVQDSMGGDIVVRSVDWLIRASLLTGITPRPGDRIVTLQGVTRQEYEVMPIGKMACWERHDNAGEMVMVHTNQVV